VTLLTEDTRIFANYREGNFRMLCGVHYTVCLKVHNTDLNTLSPLMRLSLHWATSLGLLVEVQLQCLSTFSTRLTWKVSVTDKATLTSERAPSIYPLNL
jgi:hypothetical protein